MTTPSRATRARCIACIATLASLPDGSAAEDTPPHRILDRVTVTGSRPSSLPTEIPTTIESITKKTIEETINATDAEDAIKYFPRLIVRKRYIGDYDHAVLGSRASGTGNSARSLVHDGILISNLLGNGASFTRRWGTRPPLERRARHRQPQRQEVLGLPSLRAADLCRGTGVRPVSPHLNVWRKQ